MSQATGPQGPAPEDQSGENARPIEADVTQVPTDTPPATDEQASDATLAGEAPSGPAEHVDSTNGTPEADSGEPEEQTADGEPADGQAPAQGDERAETESDADSDRPPARPRQPRPTVVARYGIMRSIGEFRHNSKTPLLRGTKLVIRTERGVELGEVIAPVCDECDSMHLTADKLKEFIRQNGSDYPFRRDGRVLRLANPQDVIDYRHLEQSAKEAATYCRQEIREMKLDMKLVSVEHLLGGERLVFFFAAEHRVDFRDLVRKLAAQYRTRIEMRQVGARDEARLVADYERCGQQCCCQSFLKDLRPVSMRMAKTQKATLDPSKISGRCGRLMCCLRYEDATYEQLRKKLPHKNTWVRTADDVIGRVVDTQIITQLVKVQLMDYTFKAIPNEDIVERNLTAPPKPETPVAKPHRQPDRPIRRRRERLGAAVEAEAATRREQSPQSGEQAETEPEATTAGASADSAGPDSTSAKPAAAGADSGRTGTDGTKKRRHRRRRKKSGSGQGQAASGAQATGQGRQSSRQQANGRDGAGGRGGGSAGSTSGEPGEKKPRRRRRRKKGPKGPGGNQPPASPPPA